MILKEIFYAVKCDRCGEIHNDGEHSFWNSDGDAFEQAFESDWIEQKGKHYCPDCYEKTDVDDEYKVSEPFPEHLKTLNKFIDRVTKAWDRKVGENENEFIVKNKFMYSANQRFTEFEEHFIKELIGPRFISLEYETLKHEKTICCIKFKK
jgi:hypothetical protein